MQKWLAAGGVVVVGIVVFVVGLMANLFSVAPAFEDLTDGFRDDVMTQEAVDQARADIGALEAVSDEFGTTVVPTLAGALEMEPAAFNDFVGAEFPAIATGVEQLPGITTQFTGVVDLMESQLGNFEDADNIPTGALPATTLPWVIAGIGILAIGIGAWMFFVGRTAALVALLLGIVVVASTLVLSLVAKSGAADEMNDAFRPVYTAELVAGSEQALQVVGAMGEQMQAEMVPTLAQQMGMTGEEVQAFIGENFPATAGALDAMPAAMDRFQGLVGAFDAQLENYETIQDTELTPIAWTVLLGGVAIALFGLWGLVATRNDEAVAEQGFEKTRPLVGSRT